MHAYDKNDNLIYDLESKEGEKLESFFVDCASVFQKEEVSRMEIFKRRDAQVLLEDKVAQLEHELETKHERFQPKPYYRRKERF